MLKKLLFPLLLISFTLYICFVNHTPGTFLTGWDSLHPEFDFPTGFSRMLSGVWREDQGVGAVAAHSHMADLPRVMILWIFSFVLPLSFIRYSYIFLCLIIGPLGMYFFLKYVFQREKESFWVYPAAFLGALYYLLNLGTVQTFYVPFEMFTTAYGFVPWLFLTAFRYLREGKKGNLIKFSATVILSAPMAYAAVLAYSVYAGLFLFLITFALVSSAHKLKIKRFFIILTLTLTLNSYWILPNIYSVINQSSVISASKINTLFSPEAFLKNQAYGNAADILLQRNFLFDWRNFVFADGKFKNLLNVWSDHLAIPNMVNLGLLVGGIAVFGILAVIIKREKVGLALIPVLILTLFFLFNANGFLGGVYSYLYNNFGLFREGFRMPFTKFSVLYQFLASFFFGNLLFSVFGHEVKKYKNFVNILHGLLFTAVISALVVFAYPMFRGELIGKNVRINIPDEYAQAYEYLNRQDIGRIAKLPMHTLYNWEYHDWGFEGSAWFSWFMSKNPQLDRDFDRFSEFNQDFYREASFALYNNDPAFFREILQKYQVRYLLLDESVVNPDRDVSILFYPETKQILSSLPGAAKVAEFNFLSIYELTGGTPVNNWVSAHSVEYGDYLPDGKNSQPLAVAVSEDLSINRGFPDPHNCDLEKKGSVEREFAKSGKVYKAKDGGVSCDYLNYPDLPYNQAFFLRIAGENKSGRGLKIYLYNQKTKRMDLEELLPAGKFDEYYYIPAKNLDGGGYTLNFETRSFGRISSENLLSAVEFYYPSARLDKGGFVHEISNNLEILDVKKYGTWGYGVNVKNDTFAPNLIQLSQGYEPGWLAFQIQDRQHRFADKLKILDHKMVSGWSNGWVVPPGIQYPISSIYMVFWPQLLEWLGMALGVGTLAVFLLRRSR